ncbi:iron ABC transporter ATP-binding protein [Agromyces sp. SYSU T0242]|uniref:iron ABC transporter ATP-binding protein n=1 Tax=Agromyces litoreus TaxID=3158561 RepID=UPI003395FDE6
MSRPNTLRPRTLLALGSLAMIGVVALAGCTASGTAPEASTAPPSADATADAGETAVPTAAPEPTEEPVPFEAACDEVLTLEQLYAFNPNYGVAPDYAPGASTVSDVVAAEGTACGWSNQSSGEVIEVGVAVLPERAYERAVGDAALHSNAVPTYGTPPDVEGFFRQSGGVGQAQVFADGYWIVVESDVLFEPGDAQMLMADVLANVSG